MKKRGYIDYIAQQGVRVQLTTVLATGGPDNFRRNVARVRTEDPRSWRVVLQPWTITEPTAGDAYQTDIDDFQRPSAIVTFGVDGVNQAVDLDWPVNGGMFSVWGDSVVVDGRVPSTWVALTSTVDIAMGASISPNADSGALRPTKTISTGLLAPAGSSAPIPVPKFARAMRWHLIFSTNAARPATAISWIFTLGPGVAQTFQETPNGIYTTAEPALAEGITLGPDIRFATVTNNGADSIRLAVEFLLDLG